MNEEKPCRVDGVLSKALGNETLLYQANGKAIHVLNPTARVIWELCDGQHTTLEMENAIRSQFQLPEPQVDIAGDIERSLQMFATAGLLVPQHKESESALTPSI